MAGIDWSDPEMQMRAVRNAQAVATSNAPLPALGPNSTPLDFFRHAMAGQMTGDGALPPAAEGAGWGEIARGNGMAMMARGPRGTLDEAAALPALEGFKGAVWYVSSDEESYRDAAQFDPEAPCRVVTVRVVNVDEATGEPAGQPTGEPAPSTPDDAAHALNPLGGASLEGEHMTVMGKVRTMLICPQSTKGEAGLRRMLVAAVVQACCHPNGSAEIAALAPHWGPCRPTRVLLPSAALADAVRAAVAGRLRCDVGVAPPRVVRAMESLYDSMRAQSDRLQAQFWYNGLSDDDLIAPRAWFKGSAPPGPGASGNGTVNQRFFRCWGWRSELEAAVRSGDRARAALVFDDGGGERGPRKGPAKEFLEMRALTAIVAKAGDLKTLQWLVRECGCHVDGVHGPGNGYGPDSDSAWKRRQHAWGIHGETPLGYAAMHGKRDCVAWLCSAGADVDAAQEKGITPLHIAVVNSHVAVIKLLVGFGARLDVADWSGKTQMALAAGFDSPALPAMQRAQRGDAGAAGGSRKTCLVCDEPATATCPCRAAWYCGRGHQAADWKAHKRAHKVIKRVKADAAVD